MTEFISRKYGNDGYEVIIKTDSHKHYTAAEEFARRLIGHAKPVTDNNVGCNWIPVTERLPDLNSKVLVCDNREDFVSIWERLDNVLWYGDDIFWVTEDITHWMHLPEPPKEVE